MTAVIEVSDVTVRRGDAYLLSHINWTVADTERWVVIGPNGAGKTTLIQLVSAQMHPSSGQVTLLGERLGRVDVFELRPRIGLCSTALEAQIPFDEAVRDLVMSAAYAIVGRWRETYDAADAARADELMTLFGVDRLARRRFGTLSQGERQRVQIARAMMTDPEILILDEPTAGLDLGGRESLLGVLTGLALDPGAPTMVLVTHQVEEIPRGMTHGLALKRGGVVAMGPIESVMTPAVLGSAFGLPLRVAQEGGRWYARAGNAPAGTAPAGNAPAGHAPAGHAPAGVVVSEPGRSPLWP